MKKIIIILMLISLNSIKTIPAQSELQTKVTDTIVPGSQEVHQKLGVKALEKEYAVIKFTKKTSDEAILTVLHLQWHGPHIEQLSASLFKKVYDHEPTQALEENLISEGKWNVTKQMLSFTLKKPLALHGITTLSLVFSVTPELEKIVKKGSFLIVSSYLPYAFQESTQEKNLTLSYHS